MVRLSTYHKLYPIIKPYRLCFTRIELGNEHSLVLGGMQSRFRL